MGLGPDAVVADPNGSYGIEEGETLELLGTAVGSPVTVEWDLNGDGTFGDASGLTPTLTWSQLETLGINDSGTRTISLRATYASGDNQTDDATLLIDNVAPTAILGTDVPTTGIDEGTASDVFHREFHRP